MIPLELCHPDELVWVAGEYGPDRVYHLYQFGLPNNSAWRKALYTRVKPRCGALPYQRVSHIPWMVGSKHLAYLSNLNLCYACIVVVCRDFPEIFSRPSCSAKK